MKYIGVQCLNHMVLNALSHIEDSIEYMSNLRNEQVFKFCAIPQVMAIATLEKCYNNSNVFKTEVKISKLLAMQLIGVKDMNDVKYWYNYFLSELEKKVDFENDINARETIDIILKSKRLLNSNDNNNNNNYVNNFEFQA